VQDHLLGVVLVSVRKGWEPDTKGAKQVARTYGVLTVLDEQLPHNLLIFACNITWILVKVHRKKVLCQWWNVRKALHGSIEETGVAEVPKTSHRLRDFEHFFYK
jgi:hypothetical protein